MARSRDYFFLDDYQQAEWFSKQCKAVKYGEQLPCVLEVLLEVDRARVLNADSFTGRRLFKQSFYEIKKAIIENNIQFRNQDKDYEKKCIRCTSFDNIKNIDIILKVFNNGSKLEWREESSNYLEPTHTQICVRDKNCIKELKYMEGECNYGT